MTLVSLFCTIACIASMHVQHVGILHMHVCIDVIMMYEFFKIKLVVYIHAHVYNIKLIIELHKLYIHSSAPVERS